jgi:plasmid maintenance system antidote protein VapI
VLGYGRQSFQSIQTEREIYDVNLKADLSGDMALRIEKAFGVKMDTLMRMRRLTALRELASARSKSECRAFPCWRLVIEMHHFA